MHFAFLKTPRQRQIALFIFAAVLLVLPWALGATFSSANSWIRVIDFACCTSCWRWV